MGDQLVANAHGIAAEVEGIRVADFIAVAARYPFVDAAESAARTALADDFGDAPLGMPDLNSYAAARKLLRTLGLSC